MKTRKGRGREGQADDGSKPATLGEGARFGKGRRKMLSDLREQKGGGRTVRVLEERRFVAQEEKIGKNDSLINQRRGILDISRVEGQNVEAYISNIEFK